MTVAIWLEEHSAIYKDSALQFLSGGIIRQMNVFRADDKRYRDHRDNKLARSSAYIAQATGAGSSGALAIGALAIGGFVMAFVVIGRLIIRQVLVQRMHLHRLKIDNLEVDELRVRKLNVVENEKGI